MSKHTGRDPHIFDELNSLEKEDVHRIDCSRFTDFVQHTPQRQKVPLFVQPEAPVYHQKFNMTVNINRGYSSKTSV